MHSTSPQLANLPSNSILQSRARMLVQDFTLLDNKMSYFLIDRPISGSLDDSDLSRYKLLTGKDIKKILSEAHTTHRYVVQDMDGNTVLTFSPLGLRGDVTRRVDTLLH